MKIAIFGKTGQVATELQRRVPNGMTIQVISRTCADFTSPETVHAAAWGVEADALINATAYTAVDEAEDEPEQARLINAASVGALAEAAAERGIPLVHISTDYVFDGHGETPFAPGDPTGPLGTYGRTKLAGEEALRSSGARHAILRTSWVFSAHRRNFVKAMLGVGAERERLSIVDDQVGGPTSAAAIADACFALARALARGHHSCTYHFSGTPNVSWADFAREIFRQAGLSPVVQNIPTSDFPTRAARPLNSQLDCTALEADFGIPRPDWRQDLADVLAELRR